MVDSSKAPSNFLSALRIAFIPLAAWLYYVVGQMWGVGFLVILALTDFVDGRVARGRGLESVVGKQLDALGDYVLAWAIIAILWRDGVISLKSAHQLSGAWSLSSLAKSA